MAEMASFWSYEENHDMEQLGQKLMCTTLELEKLKTEAMEEMRKNKEYIKQLIELLRFAIQERDEARNQFQKLLSTTTPTAAGESFPSIPLFNSDKKPNPTRANSSVTESNSLSETYNLHSHGSSPVDSLFDAVSSPDFSNINYVVSNQHLVQDNLDPASLIIDNLAKVSILPQKGKFLQAVMRAGPLLQTLLVAGPLPRWRNPPQLQSFQIPPFSVKPCDGQPSQVNSASMLSFGNSLSCGSLIPPLMNSNGYNPLNKRQRLS